MQALARVPLNMPQHYQAKLHTQEILMSQQSEFAEPQLMQMIPVRGATPQRVGRVSWLFYRGFGKLKQPAKIQAAFFEANRLRA